MGGAPALLQLCPPGEGGVRDYAETLAAAWTTAGTASALWCPTASDARGPGLPPPVQAWLGPAAHAQDDAWLVLHFSGYGYAARGLCDWLPAALARWRREAGPRLRLAVVFHELFASGPPWRSAFWLSRWQAAIATRLAGMADLACTTGERPARWLQPRLRPGVTLAVQPVFSNIGEPVDADVTPPAARAPQAVLFGGAGTRQRTAEALRTLPPGWWRPLGITRLVEVGSGPPCQGLPDGLPVDVLGRLDARPLATLLAGSRYGLLDYPAGELGKSGVAAALFAHGCIALNVRPPEADADGLQARRHYLALRADAGVASTAADALAAMAAEARAWYAPHTAARQAAHLLAQIRQADQNASKASRRSLAMRPAR